MSSTSWIPEASRLSEISTSSIRRMFEVVAKAKREGKDVVNLSIGEPDFDTHPSLVEKACKAMKDGFTHYSSNFGLDELRSLIAERNGVEPDNVMLTAGGSEALISVSLSFIEKGSKVIIPTPNFLSYFTYSKLCEGETVQIKTHNDNFEINTDKLNEKMSKEVSIIFINYPNNPTGVVMKNNALREIADIASEYNAILISDEIYNSIYYDRKPDSLASAGYDNTIIVNGFSKSLAMTGWRVGYIIANERYLESILKVHQVNGVCAPSFTQKAIADIMKDGKDKEITAEMVKEFRKRRDFVLKRLKDIGLNTVKPEGAFYVFPEVPINCVEFSEKLVDSGVVVTPGLPFGDGNENYIRISYANSMEMLEKAMDRIEAFISEL